jgi:hypothetical protein
MVHAVHPTCPPEDGHMNYDYNEVRIWLPGVRVYAWIQSWDCQHVADSLARSKPLGEFDSTLCDLMLHGF